MSDNMITCEAMRDQLALLLYGELSFDEEERFDAHLDSCSDCRAALDRQKALHAAIDDLEITPSPALLSTCRDAFFEAIDLRTADSQHAAELHERPLQIASARKTESWWSQVRSSFEGLTAHWMRPAGAMAMLAIGFMAARMIPAWGPMSAGSNGNNANYSAMDLASLGATQVRNVQEDANGRVNIMLNETRQRTVSGNLQDAAIRNLLVAAAKGSADPGLRAETVTILVSGAGSSDVRDTLVFALENDQNAVVRWRAMEGLKAYVADRSVQTALARVLQRDLNPGIRTQAIDLLTEPGASIDREVVGVLQETMGREDDAYVRERAQRMLEAVKASAGVY